MIRMHKPLPDIPDKRYFSIGQASELCLVKPHVLRYWEQEFPQLKPVTRAGGRRYYQVNDIQLIRRIRVLLYDEGYTIAGAKQAIKQEGGASFSLPPVSENKITSNTISLVIEELEQLLKELHS